jgi:hypothetical protein
VIVPHISIGPPKPDFGQGRLHIKTKGPSSPLS